MCALLSLATSNSESSPEIFLKAAEYVGIAPEESMVLEDSRLGLQAAKAAKMTGVLIPDLVAADEEMKSNAAYIMPSLKEVITLLEEK